MKGGGIQGAFPGLQIKAYCLLSWDGSNLTLVKGGNVASAVRNAQGDYTITFTSALATATYLQDVGSDLFSFDLVTQVTKTTAASRVAITVGGLSIDPTAFYMAFYE